MDRQIEESINQLQSQSIAFEGIMATYQRSYLTRFANRVEGVLEDCRVRPNTEYINEKVNYIKNVLARAEDLVKATIYKNVKDLNKIANGESHDLADNLGQVADMKTNFQKIIKSQIDVNEIKYDMVSALKIRDNEEAIYLVGKMITNQLETLQDELIHETNKVFDKIMQINFEQKQVKEQNKTVEKIYIMTSDGKYFVIEKTAEETNLRPLMPDEELGFIRYGGNEADQLYQQLKHTLPVVEEKKELIVIKNSKNEQYTIEKAGDSIMLRAWHPADSFEADKFISGPEADMLYEQLSSTLIVEQQQMTNVNEQVFESEAARQFK